ncbi:MAG TPA: hypothetical protein VFO07_02010, partial [Roseiflexaceae bacterium]|nr:hypothetical protein [Roseiflexaceae bacterium]
SRGMRAHLLGTALSLVRRRVSFRLRQQVLAAIPAVRRAVETRLRIGDIDWPRTHVYAALDHQELWVNLCGRQPAGCVAPDDYAALCDRLAAALLAWRDPQSDLPYINAVHRRPYITAASGCLPPDLWLEWNPAAAPMRLHPLISGDHEPEGVLIVAGADVCPQRLDTCSLIDIAPLALRCLGLPPPEHIEGRVPEALFQPADSRGVYD